MNLPKLFVDRPGQYLLKDGMKVNVTSPTEMKQ